MSEETWKGYKAFEPGLICKGKQYAENTVFEEVGGNICGAGMMHYCENPFDVLNYYPLVNADGNVSDFAEVEALEKPITEGDKSATKKLKIGVKLGLDGFIKACVDFLYEKTIKDMPDASISSGRYAQIGSSGDDAVVVSEADRAVVAIVGKRGKVKAPVGTWITLAEYGEWDGEGCPCLCVKSAQIDGETLKENVFYTLKNGEFTEVE